MWPDESQIVLLSVACVSFVSSLFCLISTTQNARHSYNTSPINAWKNILTHNSLFTAHYSILNAHCQVLIAQCSLITAPLLIAHNSHTKHNYSLLTTHTQRTIHYSQLIFYHERRQRSLLHALSHLRPTSRWTWYLMSRKFFNCLSRVFRFFIDLPRHIHTTAVQSTCEKKKLTPHN